MNEFDWTRNEDVAAAIGAQLTAAIAGLVNQGRDETELINGYMAGRYTFHVHRDEMTLLEGVTERT